MKRSYQRPVEWCFFQFFVAFFCDFNAFFCDFFCCFMLFRYDFCACFVAFCCAEPAWATAGTESARPRRIKRIQAVTFFTGSPRNRLLRILQPELPDQETFPSASGMLLTEMSRGDVGMRRSHPRQRIQHLWRGPRPWKDCTARNPGASVYLGCKNHPVTADICPPREF